MFMVFDFKIFALGHLLFGNKWAKPNFFAKLLLGGGSNYNFLRLPLFTKFTRKVYL